MIIKNKTESSDVFDSYGRWVGIPLYLDEKVKAFFCFLGFFFQRVSALGWALLSTQIPVLPRQVFEVFIVLKITIFSSLSVGESKSQSGSSACLRCFSILPALKSMVVRVLSVGPSSLGIHGSTPKLKQLLSPFGFCVAGTTDVSGIYVLWGLSHSSSPFQNTNPHLISIILHVNCFTLKRDIILVC